VAGEAWIWRRNANFPGTHYSHPGIGKLRPGITRTRRCLNPREPSRESERHAAEILPQSHRSFVVGQLRASNGMEGSVCISVTTAELLS
jgi:hypothetical protein